MGRILAEIASLPDIPDNVRNIMVSYGSFYNETREKKLLGLEQEHPGLAAELDRNNGPQPPPLPPSA